MESDLHEFLKEVVFSELERYGYDLYIEPSESPSGRLNWSFFRPDILGLICTKAEFRLVLVECETNPSIRRINSKMFKIRRWLTLQKRLGEKHNFRLLLVIPLGMLCKVNKLDIRRVWEIWIVNFRGEIIDKIPRHVTS